MKVSVIEYLADMANDVQDQAGRWTDEQGREWAQRYWDIRHDKSLDDAQRTESLKAHSEEFRDKLNVDTNERGNTVIRRHLSADRYLFDFDSEFRADGWLQFDTHQDASYFGVWVNPKKHQTFTYCEGDVTLVLCPDVQHYNAEIHNACEFYRPGFELIAMQSVDDLAALLLGSAPSGLPVEVQRQDRSQFLIAE